jgi:hypothetical protein
MQRSKKMQHFQGKLFATSGQDREMGSSEVCNVYFVPVSCPLGPSQPRPRPSSRSRWSDFPGGQKGNELILAQGGSVSRDIRIRNLLSSNSKENLDLIYSVLWVLYDFFLSGKTEVNAPSKTKAK